MSAECQQAALEYKAHGWEPLAVPFKAKNPGRRGWERERTSVEDIPRIFNGHPENIGVLMGTPSNGLHDIDLDCPEAGPLAGVFLPLTALVFGRKSKPRSHRLYIVTPSLATKQYRSPDGEMLLEIRSTGVQTIFPPSVHPSGETIEWVGGQVGEPPTVDGDDLLIRCGRLAAACLLVRSWPKKGSRHEAAKALAGGLLNGGWGAEQVTTFLRAVMRAAGDEEAETRLANVRSTVNRLQSDRAITGWPTLASIIGKREVDKVIEWLGIKAATRATDGSHDTITVSSPQPVPVPAKREWPEPPGDDAYGGLAGEVVNAVLPHTEADPVNILAHTLAGFACAVGPLPHLMLGATRHTPRVFPLIAGSTSKARKTDGASPTRILLERADPDFAPARIQSGLASGEGLIHAVRDPLMKNGVQIDDGVLDKRIWSLETEFSRLITAMNRQGNTLSALVREAWDRGDLQSLSKGSPERATGAHVVLTGHITIEELKAQINAVDCANGFLNRFLILIVKRSKLLPLPEPIPKETLDRLGGKLRATLEQARRVEQMKLDSEAGRLWYAVYESLSAEREGLSGGILARAEAQTLRLSMLYALLDGEGIIRASHLKSALELWGYAERSVEYIFGGLSGNPLADLIYRHLLSVDRMGRTEISGLLGRHESSTKIQQALDMLAETGKAFSFTLVGENGGRPTEYWMAIREGGE